MRSYVIEVRDFSGNTAFIEAFEGTELTAKQRAAELVQKLEAASAHVLDALDHREVFRVAERT
jgi:hypothetical protein